jgi:hypothetical protein
VIRWRLEDEYTAERAWEIPEKWWNIYEARYLMKKYQHASFSNFTDDELNRATEEATAQFYNDHPEADPRKREARHKAIVGLLGDYMAEEFEKHRQAQDGKVKEADFRPELFLRNRARDILRPYSHYNFTDREIDRAVAKALADFDAFYYEDGVNPHHENRKVGLELAGELLSDIWNTVVATIDSFYNTQHGKQPQDPELGYVEFDPYYYEYTTSDSDEDRRYGPWSGHRRDGYNADSD